MKNQTIFIFVVALILFFSLQVIASDTWTIEILAENGGNPSQIIVNNEGIHIAYFDDSNWTIKYIFMNHNSKIIRQQSEKGGPFFSMAVDNSGNPHICYPGYSGLYYASWNKTKNSWDVSLLDSQSTVIGVSMALDSSGNLHAVYSALGGENGNFIIKYIIYNKDSLDVKWTVQEKSIGDSISLALDNQENPHFCYVVPKGNVSILKYIYFDGYSWKTEIVDNYGVRPSLVLDKHNLPHISYGNISTKNLEYAWFDGTEWNIETVDSNENVGAYSAIALDSKGNPHIAYCDLLNRNLKYAWWDGKKWNIKIIDSNGDVGIWPSLAIDKNDISYITYAGNRTLKYAVSSEPIPNSSSNTTEYNQFLILPISLVAITIIAALLIWYFKKKGSKGKEIEPKEVKTKNENEWP